MPHSKRITEFWKHHLIFSKPKITPILYMVLLVIFTFSNVLNAQTAPSVGYSSSQTYNINQAISTLPPTNTGGTVRPGTFSNVSIYAGTGSLGSTNNANPLLATFDKPSAITGDELGNHYVAEYSGKRIRKIDSDGVVTTVAQFTGLNLYGLVINPSNGDLYFTGNHYICKLANSNSANYPNQSPTYTYTSDTATIVAGQSSSGFINDTGTAAKFNTPVGIKISPDNTYLLVADFSNNRIRKIEIGTGVVTTFAGTGAAGDLNTTDPLTSTFRNPLDVAFASPTLIYISEGLQNNTGITGNRIRKIENETVTLFAGSATGALGFKDGNGSNAGFYTPWGLTLDGAGNLYVAERGNYKIRKITPSGVVSTIAGALTASYGTTNDLGLNARFDYPMGIYYEPNGGYILQTDYATHKIRKIDVSGYEISHPLPAGLSFNTGTGIITGTPTSYTLKTYYANNFNSAELGTTSIGGVPTLNTDAELVGGMLRLTKAEDNQYGGFLVPEGGDNSNLFAINFNLINGNTGTIADGISYSYAPDAVVTNTGNPAEEGSGTKIRVSFREYSDKGIKIYYGATVLASSANITWTGAKSTPVSININNEGQLTMTLNGIALFTDVQLPADYLNSDKSTWKHVFKARTGTENDLHGIDNLVISKGFGQATYGITANNYGGSNSTSLNILVKDPDPTITSFTPATGYVGSLVTVNGSNLSSLTSITIGGVPAIIVSNNGNTLVAMVMPGASSGSISVFNYGGTASATGNFTITASLPPCAQQGTKLVGTGNVGISRQGYSVALSADGNTAIVGGQADNNYMGAAWVYIRNGSTWIQQGTKLVGTGNVGPPSQGMSIALSADGNTAIVGGTSDNDSTGAAWIFTRTGSTWTQQGTKLVGTGATGGIGGTGLGRSVSLSADGNTAIVGGYGDNSNIGAAWIFTRSDNTWTQQGFKLVGTGRTGSARQGSSVSLSADGYTAIVGGPNDNNNVGAAWVYTRFGNTWTQQGTKLVGLNSVGAAYQGNSVSLSADGNTAIVGGSGDNSSVGASWIYTRAGNTWSQQGTKLVGTDGTVYANQGSSVSLSADGNTAFFGGNYDNGQQGASWVFVRSGSTWTQHGTKLVGTNNTTNAQLGFSVALSADGNTAIAGGFIDNYQTGAAWVFTTSKNQWTGAVNTAWNTAGNWSDNNVPTITDDVIINTSTPNAPTLNVVYTVGAGKSLTIGNTGTLKVAPNASLIIAGIVDFGSKSVTFKSDATGTGVLGAITGSLINADNVTTERYIPALRAFRFITPSVTTTTSIKANWQEGANNSSVLFANNMNPKPGFGTHITGSSTGSNGFDATQTTNASLFGFDNSTGQWTTIANTDVNLLNAGTAYRLMVRGDRSIDLNNNAPTPTPTTLRATGTLFTGPKTLSGAALNQVANGYSLIGNPYQAPVDMKAVLDAATGLATQYCYVWEPRQNTRGAYVSVGVQTGVNSISGSFATKYLQPGQAAFIRKDATATSASLTFLEADKHLTTNENVFRPEASNLSLLKVSIDSNGRNLDGLAIVFDPTSNNAIDANDAGKLGNLDEDIATSNNGSLSSIESRQFPVNNEEIQLYATKFRATNYTLKTTLENYSGPTPYLLDTYTQNYTLLNGNSETIYPFSINSTIPNSVATNRFKIVFGNAVLSTTDFEKGCYLYPNPSADSAFYVHLNGLNSSTRVTLFNTLGQQILLNVNTTENNSYFCKTASKLPSGTYIVVIEQDGKKVTKKWIVQ